MAENTKISWADHTLNPWIGCTKVGPGCDHCYAEADFDKRRHIVQWGAGQPRHRTKPATWQQALRWNQKAKNGEFVECPECQWRGDLSKADARGGRCPGCGSLPRLFNSVRPRVFCASLADVFDNEVPADWRTDLFALIRATPHLDWLLLTKRIGNAKNMIFDARVSALMPGELPDPEPIRNVWLGATITSQQEADRDIRKLLSVPAEKHFLSMEPLLGPVDLTNVPMPESGHGEHEFSPIITGNALNRPLEYPRLPEVDWVIAGGESGPNARPMDPDWARSLSDQCRAAGAAFFMKQLGGTKDKRGDLSDLPTDLRIREVPNGKH